MMLKKVKSFKIYLIIFFLSVITYSKAARILAYYPVPSISHQNAFRPLTLELIKRGHEVTVITTDPIFPKGETPANLTEIDFHDISYRTWSDLANKLSGNNNYMPSQVANIFSLLNKICDVHFETQEIKDIISVRKNDFDLLLVQSCARPTLALTHVMEVPVIHVSSSGNWIQDYDIVGAPTHPILYPTTTNYRNYNMTFWEKFLEMFKALHIKYISYTTEEADLKMMRTHFGKDLPDFKVLMDNVDLLFLNVHPIWENNRPVPSNVIYVGGMHLKPPMDLPEDLETFLNSSKNGVIYMSFGTNSKSSLLPPEIIRVFTNVFSRLPYDVIWKWETDELPRKPKNVRIQKWLPQPDLLRHPKVRLFITQAGLQSVEEAIAAGVPMVAIPMRVDQFLNTENMVKYGIALHLDLNTLTENGFKVAIDTILSDGSYPKNVAKLRNLIYDHPMKPLDRAIWWIDYVLRHKGAKHLRSPGANMSLLEYIQIDLIAAVCAMALVVSLTAYFIVRLLFVTFKNKFKSVIKTKVK